MKTLLLIFVLYMVDTKIVVGDSNIYGPGGVNLGADGNPELLFKEMEEERQRKKADKVKRAGPALTLQQQRNGHYFVKGAINDFPLVFMIDTGASFVTLPKAAALKAGIQCEQDGVMNTANGKVNVCAGTIARLKFGEFTMINVGCLIAPNLEGALLGNNVLNKFNMVQNGGELQITQ